MTHVPFPEGPDAAAPPDDEEDLRSRTDAKKERQASEEMLMQLGKTLVELNDRLLNGLELPEDALRVINDARRIQAPAARNRAMRLVRAALRDLDAKRIQRRLRDLQDPPPAAARAPSGEPSPLLAWRDRLVSGGDEAIEAFMTEFPAADRQRLRQLARNVRKATESARKQSLDALAKLLREHLR